MVEPLLRAIGALATAGRTTVLLAASMQHSPETLRAFASRAAAEGFGVELLGGEEAQPAARFRSDEVRVFRLLRLSHCARPRAAAEGAAAAGRPTKSKKRSRPRRDESRGDEEVK